MNKQRTIQQNKALHLYFTKVAELLNNSGLEQKVILAKIPDIPWEGSTIKEIIWRPIMKAQLLKRSTTEMTTRDVIDVYDTVNRFLADLGIHEDWPSLESLLNKKYDICP